MQQIKVTMKEIYDAMRPSVERNKKKYTRKTKHKNERKNFGYQKNFGTLTPR